ncbi:MAG TPA: methyl-accepting chemotaxis protein, partial [Oxalobacteraceae bacterium]|nr:methyl-accepting chemotaxis protein [Oxalobacteraceae bacterium]
MSFGNLKIGARLGSGFAFILVLLACAIGLGMNSMQRIGMRMNQIVDNHNAKIFSANEMVDNFRDIGLNISNIVLLGEDAAAVQEEKNKMAAARTKYGKAKKVLVDTGLNDEEKELLTKLDDAIKFAVPFNNKVVELASENKQAEATALLTQQAIPAIRKAIAVIDELVIYERDLAKGAVEEAKGVYSTAQAMMLGLGALGVALGILIAWLITRSITRPIGQAVQVARTVAAGDLTSR